MRIFLALLAFFMLAPSAQAATGTLVSRTPEFLDGELVHGETEFFVKTNQGTVKLEDQQDKELVGQKVSIQDADQDQGIQGQAKAIGGVRAAATSGLGEHKLAVLLVNFTNTTPPALTAETVRAQIFGPSGARQFYLEQSNNAVSFVGKNSASGDVYGWLNIPISSAGCPVDQISEQSRAVAASQGIDLNGYDHVMFFYPKVADCAFGGLADVRGPESWINGALQTGLISHELGHNLGADHAGSLTCNNGAPVAVAPDANCTLTEYGDPFDSMGGPINPRLFSAWHRAQIGQLPASAETFVNASGSYVIASPNLFANAEPKYLLVPRRVQGQPTKSLYAIEIRNTYGMFDSFAANSPVTTGASIRIVPNIKSEGPSKLIDTNPQTPAFTDAPLQPGQTFTDAEYGISISITSGGGLMTANVTTPGILDTTPPAAPTLTVEKAGNGLQLDWGTIATNTAEDDEGIAAYEVVRNGTVLVSTLETAFLDTQLQGITKATYSVAAVDKAGNRSKSQDVVFDVPDFSAPSVPTNPKAKLKNGSVELSWNKSTDDRGYVQYSVLQNNKVIATTTRTSYKVANPGQGAMSYVITARDRAGNTATSPAIVKDARASGAIYISKPLIETSKSLGKSRTITVRAAKASSMAIYINNKKVKSTRSSKATYRIPAKYKTAKIKVTAKIKGKNGKRIYKLSRNRISL